jgi:hypothetical protein
MKPLMGVGLAVLILGILSFFVPVPHHENHGVKIGDAHVGVQTEHSERLSPVIGGVLVAVGAVMMIAGGRGRAA